jgi:hypothetical protein
VTAHIRLGAGRQFVTFNTFHRKIRPSRTTHTLQNTNLNAEKMWLNKIYRQFVCKLRKRYTVRAAQTDYSGTI